MSLKHVVALTLGVGILADVVPTLSFAKPASFDGKWSVRLVTESGACDSSYSQTIAIENGQVRPVTGGAGALSVSGGVGNDGSVALTIRRSIAQANAHGRLNPQTGAGNWNVALLGCIGRWTASRA